MTQSLYSLTLIQEKWKHVSIQWLVYKFSWHFIYNSPKLEITQAAIKMWMDKYVVAYLYNKILLSNKMEWIIDTHKNMAESQPGWGTKIPHATGCGQKFKKKLKKLKKNKITASCFPSELPFPCLSSQLTTSENFSNFDVTSC